MLTPTQLSLDSFVRRANQALATLARELAGALATGDEYASARLTYRGLLLAQGCASVGTSTNGLTGQQRLYIAEKLLGLLPETVPTTTDPTAVAPTLSLGTLAPRIRGQVDTAPLTINGTLTGTLPAGAQLLVSRDGREIARQPAVAGRYLVVDPTPGLRYQVEITGTSLLARRSRVLSSPVFCGGGPAGASAAYVLTLPSFAVGFSNGVGRFTVIGARNRFLLAVPASLGTVTALLQPNDDNADVSMAFASRTVTLDFGLDGRDQYVVLENYANFLGSFTLDAYLNNKLPVTTASSGTPGTSLPPSAGTAPTTTDPATLYVAAGYVQDGYVA